MTFTILIAPSGFKESLSVDDVTQAISAGVRAALPSAEVLEAPMVDGGEGFTQALVNATGGHLHEATVTGPVGQPVSSFFGIMGGSWRRTAVLEMAAAAGLSLVPKSMRDPGRTTSYGVGELILRALDHGADRILVGCGDSGINDGGAGMAQALGARLLDAEGQEIGFGGYELKRLADIDTSELDPRLAHVSIDVAVNWHNVLLGPKGVARVFGPQKGASPEQVAELEAGLERYAALIHRQMGLRLGKANGSGASGGLGTGLVAFAGATLHPRFDIVMQYLNFDQMLEQADLVITAEGSLDGQSPYGKVPCEVARRAQERGIQTIALAGTIGKGVRETLDNGIDAFASIIKRPCSLDEAIDKGEKLLRRAAEDAMRMMIVGWRLADRPAVAQGARR
ncbi:glycerate kinase [Roseobacter cerasinus]|uniref:Glycerate kinase n=1 Tax=Roseobacter cerasinus TaxID=2602289 RepID=A0A640VJA4_9RHOB|nr:glycerate kinase [Roseobacter cerasinus]GFE48423.1 glycerate kinase [Roseobacter cerasinus]